MYHGAGASRRWAEWVVSATHSVLTTSLSQVCERRHRAQIGSSLRLADPKPIASMGRADRLAMSFGKEWSLKNYENDKPW